MRKTLHFTKAAWKGEQLILQADSPVSLSEVHAAGQMVVDSDAYAFVYLAEENDEFIYLYIHESTWTELQKALDQEARLFAEGTEGKLELEGWKEELSYLISNIEGNSNYGDEMVSKVESVFLQEQ
ncbi:UPF0738 family protein [Bacillus thermotolerans]|uniref:UPF0738 family protein n=1 Tax=Bacillus thermotolerans TaxID=1221996 RepID=UPI0005806546|nr:hypothetical protein [Bacillus thermotolerans]KKB38107.1 hypothetical protein QY97_03482 [Bacillus thermotolerans]